VLLRWADAARQAGRLHDAEPALEQAVAAFRAQGDVRRAGEALAVLSSVRYSLGEPDHVRLAEEAVALLEHHPGRELVDALAGLASAYWVARQNELAIRTADRALDVALRLGLPLPGRALGVRG